MLYFCHKTSRKTVSLSGVWLPKTGGQQQRGVYVIAKGFQRFHLINSFRIGLYWAEIKCPHRVNTLKWISSQFSRFVNRYYYTSQLKRANNTNNRKMLHFTCRLVAVLIPRRFDFVLVFVGLLCNPPATTAAKVAGHSIIIRRNTVFLMCVEGL